MKIILLNGSTEYVLAHGPARTLGQHRGPADISHDNSISTQVQPGLRAAAVSVRNRYNMTTVYGFTVVVELADLQLAQTLCATYAATLPRSGDLKVVQTVGGVDQVKTLAGAVLQRLGLRQSGVSVNIRYEFTGGNFT